MKTLPYTFWYMPLYGIYLLIDQNVTQKAWTIPLPKGGSVEYELIMIFVIIGSILLGPELAKATVFSPKENIKDAFWSIGIAVVYVIGFLFYSPFQHQLFGVYVILTITDVIAGLRTMFGVFARSWSNDSAS